MNIRKIAFCGIFTALTAIGAFIRIPLPGIPVTLQAFFVFMAGLMLDPQYAFFSQLAYTVIGLIGLPVFSNGGGIGYMLQPSFGFILGFCACAPVVSLTVRKSLRCFIYSRDKRALNSIKIFSGMLVSILTLYAFGIVYIFLINNYYIGKTVSLWAVTTSVTGTFILIDIVKFALAIPLCAAIYRRLPKEWL